MKRTFLSHSSLINCQNTPTSDKSSTNDWRDLSHKQDNIEIEPCDIYLQEETSDYWTMIDDFVPCWTLVCDDSFEVSLCSRRLTDTPQLDHCDHREGEGCHRNRNLVQWLTRRICPISIRCVFQRFPMFVRIETMLVRWIHLFDFSH